MSICRFATVVVLVLLAAGSSLAQAPSKVSFQGFLTDDVGSPIDGSQAMTFKLYKSAVEVWSENQTVTVADGLFHVALGRGIPLDTVAFNVPIQLGITVGKDPEMHRISLLSAASARALPGLYTFYSESGSASSYNVVGGAPNNIVLPSHVGVTIGGGGGTDGTPQPNHAYGDFATIGGGLGNSASKKAVVSGGSGNNALATGATIGGGNSNNVNSTLATVGGGLGNSATDSSAWVGGGSLNTASGSHSAVSGGRSNTSSGNRSAIGGGANNAASGDYSTIPGGAGNEANENFTFAAGRRAKANHTGSFVWADATNADFASGASDQFLIRAGGGVGIGTATTGSPLTVNGRIESLADGFKFPDGTVQTTAASLANYWAVGGNAGTTPGTDYIGTSDAAALEIRAGGGVGIGTDSPDAAAKLDVNGPIHLSLPSPTSTLLYANTNHTGTPTGDGFRMLYSPNAIGAGKGALMFEKTDGAVLDPDGGILFMNRGSDGAIETALGIMGDGDIGIGTYSPNANLDLHVGPGPALFRISADSDNSGDPDNALIQLRQDGGNTGVSIGFAEPGFGSDVFGIGRRHTGTNKYDTFVIQTIDGDVGIGTNDPGDNRLRVVNGRSSGTSTATIWAENTSSSDGIAGYFRTAGTDATVVFSHTGTGDLIKAFSAGDLKFAVRNNGDIDYDGTLGTPASDLAEVFEVEGSVPDYEPGDVLVISLEADRQVAKCDQPYSSRVVGVYATKPGVQLGTPVEGRTVPMGVVGVIPTKVSSENGAISRGDLLVTSETEGHAMKADPVIVNGVEIYPSGTILGKALEAFEGPGTGMIEVLVNTQ